MQPMSTFDPHLPSHVHDRLNDRTLEWKTGWAGKYRQYARMVSENGQDVVYFDGLVLDGWIVARALSCPRGSCDPYAI